MPNEKSNEMVNVLVEMRTSDIEPNRIAPMSMNAVKNQIKVGLASFQLDENFKPIVMQQEPGKNSAELFSAPGHENSTFVIRGMIPENQIEALKKMENVIDVYPNPKGIIAPMADPVDCNPLQPKGDLVEVARFLGTNKLWEQGIKGDNIVIGIVDSGITAEGRANPREWSIPFVKQAIGGFREDWGKFTDIELKHGNMTATDALGIAPNAKIYDLRIFSKNGIEESFLDIVFQAYDWAIQQFRRNGTPQILSNSWGFIGAFPGVTDNPRHPMNRKVLEAINTGIMVLFSAGNCGDPCGSRDPKRCITNGPGQSIHGINGHSSVMTVGAANIREVRAGYSAQGPANFDARKPDFCAPTHFTGYFQSDTGTSAACPIAAGVVALLKQAKKDLTQEKVKNILVKTAVNLEEPGWDINTGAGMIQAHSAFQLLVRELQPV